MTTDSRQVRLSNPLIFSAKNKSTGKHATAADAAKAAQKIKGTSIKLPKKAVVKTGTPGHGPGYQKGKFTGNFFGGG